MFCSNLIIPYFEVTSLFIGSYHFNTYIERKKAKKLREICRDKNKIKRCSEKCAVIFTTDLRYGKLKTEVKYFDLVWSCKVYAFY